MNPYTSPTSAATASFRLFDLLAADYLFYDAQTASVLLCANQTRISFSCPSLLDFLEHAALYFGSSLDGRKQAYQVFMKQTKLIPLCLSIHPLLCLLPTCSQQNPDLCYVNYLQIDRITKSPQKNRAIIAFKDGLQLEAGSFASMERIYLKASWFIYHYSSQSSQ
ncbi:competence protein ComK [Erysipelotrichaceae bacterium RD49]|nr:competence protein ComK [Erysipelotrichaceae bacterium RD49]